MEEEEEVVEVVVVVVEEEGEEEEAHEGRPVAAPVVPEMEEATAGRGVETGPPRKIGSDEKHFR